MSTDTASPVTAERSLPVGLVPTPTQDYREYRKMKRLTHQPATPSASPPPAPPSGARVLIWEQDPTVGEIGIRKAYLAGSFVTGPRDARITNGTGAVSTVKGKR